jgi:hypothetical protein
MKPPKYLNNKQKKENAEMNFGEILTKAWKIIWRYKILWVFGILSSCGQGGGGGGGSGNAGVQYSGGDANLPPGIRNFFNNFEYFFENIQGWQIAALIIGAILFFLILWLIFTSLSTIGRIGLIQGTVKGKDAVEGEPAAGMIFGELFKSGKPFFWRIFGFNFLAGIVVFIAVLLLIIPLSAIAVVTFGIGLLCLIPLICLLIPVGWLVTVLFEQVNIAIVVENLNIPNGFKRGWDVLRENIGNLIVMGLILLLGGGILGFILALPLIAVVLPLVIGVISGASSGSNAFFSGGIIASALCCAAYLPVIIVLNGILQAYIKSAWTLTYLEITGHEAASTAILGQELAEKDFLEKGLPEETE